MSATLRGLVLVALGALSACELWAGIPDYQAADDTVINDPDGGVDSPDGDVVTTCGSELQCTAPAVCVEGSCRSCDDDAHCGPVDEAVCLPDGTCAALQRIAYASPTGTGAAPCPKAVPCSVDTAFAATGASATLDIVKLQPGSYPRATELSVVDQLVTVAGQGATLTATETVTLLRLETGSLTVVGATLVGNQTFDIMCQSSTNASMRLHRVLLTGGVYGVGNYACTTELTRSAVMQNTGLGIFQLGGALALSNTVVIGNGQAGGGSGGVYISGGTAQITLSTIVGNVAMAMNEGGGITCMNATVTATSSIVTFNTGPLAISPACTLNYSIVDPAYNGGANNLKVNPMFLGVGDYHLQPSSPARGAADPALTSPAVDYEGDARPNGGTRFDIGADELM